MHHIRRRLIALFILIVTSLLTIAGAYAYWRGKEEQQTELANIGQALQARLETSLPGIIWNFDEIQLGQSLDAEMISPQIHMIAILIDGNLIAGRIRQNGQVEKLERLPQPSAQAIEFDLFYQENRAHALGQVVVTLSREQMEARLRQIIVDKMFEILLLDIAIVLALSQSLTAVLIRPLRQLKEMLDRAAEQTGEDDEDLHLPESKYKEFAEVANGYNRIAQALLGNLKEKRQAEIRMRAAKEAAEQAYLQLKDAQASLVQSEKMASLGNLVAGIAHEINTPVGVIMTGASVLAEESQVFRQEFEAGTLKKSAALQYVDTAVQSSQLILANAERAAELIQSFKRVAVDQTSEARRVFELGHYLEEVIMSLRPTLKHSAISVEIVSNEKIEMDSYPGALSQILTNFVTNALMHAFDPGQEGRITIMASSNTDLVQLIVRDNGRGVAPENLARIFDPFFTTQRSKGGSGLGLHIVFNLVSQTLGGTIRVESAPGEGTAFIMQLPHSAPEPQAPNESA